MQTRSTTKRKNSKLNQGVDTIQPVGKKTLPSRVETHEETETPTYQIISTQSRFWSYGSYTFSKEEQEEFEKEQKIWNQSREIAERKRIAKKEEEEREAEEREQKMAMENKRQKKERNPPKYKYNPLVKEIILTQTTPKNLRKSIKAIIKHNYELVGVEKSMENLSHLYNTLHKPKTIGLAIVSIPVVIEKALFAYQTNIYPDYTGFGKPYCFLSGHTITTVGTYYRNLDRAIEYLVFLMENGLFGMWKPKKIPKWNEDIFFSFQ